MEIMTELSEFHTRFNDFLSAGMSNTCLNFQREKNLCHSCILKITLRLNLA
jgi:hypothetical protein